MNLAEKIQNGIHHLPELLLQEVLDFIGYLEYRHGVPKRAYDSENRQNGDSVAVQAIAAFRGSGKGGGTERLLAARRADREQEA